MALLFSRVDAGGESLSDERIEGVDPRVDVVGVGRRARTEAGEGADHVTGRLIEGRRTACADARRLGDHELGRGGVHDEHVLAKELVAGRASVADGSNVLSFRCADALDDRRGDGLDGAIEQEQRDVRVAQHVGLRHEDVEPDGDGGGRGVAHLHDEGRGFSCDFT